MSLIIEWLAALLAVAHLIAAFIAGGHALLTKQDPRAAWGWIAVCLLFPLAGSLLYYLFGVNRVRRLARNIIRDPDYSVPAGPTLAPAEVIGEAFAALALTADALTGRPAVPGNAIRALHDGEQAYPAMLAAIASARERVWLSTYIFRHDNTGRAFKAALQDAVKRGVEVRVLIDGLGAWYGLALMPWRLRRAGVPVASFFPPRLFPPMLYINLRNHRKLLIVDGHTAFCGGMNIGDNHLCGAEQRHAVSDVHFEIRGPIVSQLAASFARDWWISRREELCIPAPDADRSGRSVCRVITDGPDQDIDKLTLILINAIAQARNEILIMTPYFIPSIELAAALRTAALRRVQVHLVLPARSNLPFVDYACRNHLPSLLEAGVQVHLQAPPFAHHKLFVVDGCYAQIGSANMDPRSLRLNFEIAVEIYDPEQAGQFAGEIRRRMQNTQLLSLDELRGRGLPRRLRDALFWLFSPYL